MKATRWPGWLAVAGVLLSLSASGQEQEDLPSLKRAEVTIPYGELKQLWEAARRGQAPRQAPARPKPPVRAIINSADYELRFESGLLAIEARYRVPAIEGMHPVVESEIVEMGRVRSTWRQRLVDGDTELFTVDVHVAFTDLAGRPRRAPEGFVEAAAEAL